MAPDDGTRSKNPSRWREIGSSGLKQFGGVVSEEWLRRLQGSYAQRTWREMSDNDATVGAILFVVEMLVRQVGWRVDPYASDPLHEDRAEFLETCLHDMSHTWSDTQAEILTMLPYGWSSLEIVYKRRAGPGQRDPMKRSRHTDGLIGWRKLPLRSQDTLEKWEFDEDGGIQGWWQFDPTGGAGSVFLPIERLLHFRTTSRKNNPEGRSILRSAFTSWWHKKHVQNMESIGVERDLAGLPIFWLPPEMFDENAPADVKSQLAEYRTIVENLRNDEQMGMCLPWIKDEDGNELIKFELAGTGSRRLFDTGAILERYSRSIAMTMLADFIMLGHERVGSLALSSDKTSLFATALGAWLESIADVFNRHAIPRLWEVNGWDSGETPTLVPGDLEKVDPKGIAEAVANFTGSGTIIPTGEQDEAWARNLVGMPEAQKAADE